MPAREAVTQCQVDTLLSILHALEPYLLTRVRGWDAEPSQVNIDGGAAAAAIATFSHVCTRLDLMTTESRRWNTSEHDEIYDGIKKAQKAHIKFLKQQIKTMLTLERPSSVYQPTIRVVGKDFIAEYGRPGEGIVGIGATPEKAMADFDIAFTQTMEERIAEVDKPNESCENTGSPKRRKRSEPKNQP